MNLQQEEHVISEFLRSIGPWSQCIVIGGGYAPIIYKLYFANGSTDMLPLKTQDIDSIIPRKISSVSGKNLAKHLIEAGFITERKSLDTPPNEIYRKEIEGLEIEIEFLTDRKARHNKDQNIAISGVVAQPLSYIELSLEMSLPFVTQTGEEGSVVTPGTWIFHKGLTFPMRRPTLKSFKDLYGIWYVATQLGDVSQKAFAELKILSKHRSAWFQKTFKKNLTEWIEQATPSDWSKLEAQDPSGMLKKGHFRSLIKQMALSG